MESTPLLIEYITGQPWAVERFTLENMAAIICRHAGGVKLSADQIGAATAQKKEAARPVENYVFDSATGTAIISISGIISKYSRMVNDVSQPKGTSIELLSEQLADAIADDNVKSILLRIESPGGSIAGLIDFADEVYNASTIKPVIAFADDQATSAAYWIGSQANVFYANKSALVGGIGVYSLVLDSSAAFDKAGLKMNIIRSGENKGVGAQGVAVTGEQIGVLQAVIDNYYESFLTAVVRGRGMNDKQLRILADGRSFTAGDAVNNKLIDGVTTLKGILSRLLLGTKPAVRLSRKGQANSQAKSPTAIELFDNNSADTFTAAVKQFCVEGKTKAAAITAAVKEYPQSHYAWLESVNR